MNKKMTIEDLAQLIEDRTKSIEKKIATDIEGLAVMVQQNMASKEFVREVVGVVLDVVKNIAQFIRVCRWLKLVYKKSHTLL